MKCPGQDSRYWKPGAVFEENCAGCGAVLEFFRDDTSRLCRNCGLRMVNPRMDFGCAAYCRHAEQCLGALPPEAAAGRKELMKQRIALEIKKFFGKDFRKIGLTSRAVAYAERLGREEKADPSVVTAAAYLLYADRKEPERPGHPAAAKNSGGDGPSVEILRRLGAPREMADEVSEILERLGRKQENENVNFKTVSDAFTLTEMEEKVKAGNGGKFDDLEASVRTESGKKIAREIINNLTNANS